MTISSFEFEDYQRGWKLERTEFAEFNLLVGLSGVGKTSIIKALRDVRAAGLSKRDAGGNSRWRIELASENQTYTWPAKYLFEITPHCLATRKHLPRLFSKTRRS